MSAAQLEISIRTFRRARKDRLEAEQLRTACWSTSGTVTLRAVLPAEDGARVIAALEKARDYLNSPRPAAAGATDREISKHVPVPAGASGQPACANAPAGARDDQTVYSRGGHDQNAPAEAREDDRDQNAPVAAPRPESQEPCQTGAGPGSTGEPVPAAPLPFTRADALLAVAACYLAHTPRDHSDADRDLVVVHIGASVLATPPPTTPESGASAPVGTQKSAHTPAPAGAPNGGDHPDTTRIDESPAAAGTQNSTDAPATAPDEDVAAAAVAQHHADTPAATGNSGSAVPAGAPHDCGAAPGGALPDAAGLFTHGQPPASSPDHPTTAGSASQATDPLVCAIAGIGAISPASAQRIARDAVIQTIICRADGHVLDFGRASWAAGDRWTFTRIGGHQVTAEQVTQLIAYDLENETRYGERELLADPTADVSDLDYRTRTRSAPPGAVRPVAGGPRPTTCSLTPTASTPHAATPHKPDPPRSRRSARQTEPGRSRRSAGPEGSAPAGARGLREHGAEIIILVGNSGGGSLMATYNSQSLSPILQPQFGGRQPPEVDNLPTAELYVILAAHPG